MPTVRDLAGNGMPRNAGTDKPLTAPNRRVTATPVGALTPQYTGEIVEFYDTITEQTYQFRASNLLNTGWVRADFEVKTP